MIPPPLARAARSVLARLEFAMGVVLLRRRGPLAPRVPNRASARALEEGLDPGRRWVEIGTARERVEIIDVPRPPPRRRTGRIRHANGENAAIEYETLERLMRRAECAGTERLPRSKSVLRA